MKIDPLQEPVIIAIKCINKRIAKQCGLSPKDIAKEAVLHKHCSPHPNVIAFMDTGEDINWRWIAMELATGGDLFDKIEPDVGIEEEIAHFYFKQLISAVDFIHARGVAHRDLKPENIFLDNGGNLKIGDFGLAALFRHSKSGKRRKCHTMCGSPPYIAPEVIKGSYAPDIADVWSCGVILFVLMCGITPWDEPLDCDPDFKRFVQQGGKTLEHPWSILPLPVLSLLRGMLKLDPEKRFKIDDVRKHPWFNRDNTLLSKKGLCKDPIELTTRLLVGLQIDFDSFEEATTSIYSQAPLNLNTSQYATKVDSDSTPYSMTQPITDMATFVDDLPQHHLSASQIYEPVSKRQKRIKRTKEEIAFEIISSDPSQLQFINDSTKRSKIHKKHVKDQLIENLNKNKNFKLFSRLTRFFTTMPIESIVPLISDALNRLGVPTSKYSTQQIHNIRLNNHVILKIKCTDSRRMPLMGHILITQEESKPENKTYEEEVDDEQDDNVILYKVEFEKTKGDPLEWRKFFKKVTVLCRDAVFINNT